MSVLRRFDKDVADLHSKMQLAANDLYMVLTAFQRVNEQMADDHLRSYFESIKEINQKVRDLRISIGLAQEEEAEAELNKEYKSGDRT